MTKQKNLFYLFLILIFIKKPLASALPNFPLWNTNKIITNISCIATNSFFSKNKMPHDEVIGTFIFEQITSNETLLTAMVEKKHLVQVLKKEGKCSKDKMMRVCGNKYLVNNFQVVINEKETTLQNQKVEVGKDFVTLTYLIPFGGSELKKIKVMSDFIFDYNDHAILRVVFELGTKSRKFDLKNRRRIITANF